MSYIIFAVHEKSQLGSIEVKYWHWRSNVLSIVFDLEVIIHRESARAAFISTKDVFLVLSCRLLSILKYSWIDIKISDP